MRQWQCKVRSNGNDICADGIATTFDDAVTSSGVSAATPGFIACSLPTGRGNCVATLGAPFPVLPFGQIVKVYNPRNGRVIYAPLIDEGPAYDAEGGTGHAGGAMIDLTPAAAQALGMTDNGPVSIRVLSGRIMPIAYVRLLVQWGMTLQEAPPCSAR